MRWRPGRPRYFTVWLEVTTRCNLQCRYCGHQYVDGRRVHADMPFGTVEAFAGSLGLLPPPVMVVFAGLGETLLYPELFRAVAFVREALGTRVHIRVATNGLLLRGRMIDKVLAADVDSIAIGVGLATELSYALYKGDGWAHVVENTKAFLAARGCAPKPRVEIRANKIDVNALCLPAFKAAWAPFLSEHDSVTIGQFMNWAGWIDRSTYTSWQLPERCVCNFLEDRLTVNSDGAVYPCCAGLVLLGTGNALALGNVTEKTLAQAYASPKLQRLRVQHTAGDYPSPCAACDAWWLG